MYEYVRVCVSIPSEKYTCNAMERALIDAHTYN